MSITAIAPYKYDGLNFKDKAFNGWKNANFPFTNGFYPRILHSILFRYDIFPTLRKKETRLIFVQPVSLYFDASISVLSHNVIPYIWDCWPYYYDKLERWLTKHKVEIAVFSSDQERKEIQKRLPQLKTIHCPEAIDTSAYQKGKDLQSRPTDVIEFGRNNNIITGLDKKEKIRYINTSLYSERPSDEKFAELLANAKIAICFPKSITHPNIAQGVETLTQRFWEAMVSRCVPWGHCPKELSDLIGYNPVIEYKDENQLDEMLCNIERYQSLVDRNHETAIRIGDWNKRMQYLHDEICIL